MVTRRLMDSSKLFMEAKQYGYATTGGGAQIVQGTSFAQGPSSMTSGSLVNKFAALGISSMGKSPASGNVKSPILSPKV